MFAHFVLKRHRIAQKSFFRLHMRHICLSHGVAHPAVRTLAAGILFCIYLSSTRRDGLGGSIRTRRKKQAAAFVFAAACLYSFYVIARKAFLFFKAAYGSTQYSCRLCFVFV